MTESAEVLLTMPARPEGVGVVRQALARSPQAICATVIGLRGNAMATFVPIVTRLVCSAAIAQGMNGSCPVSGVVSPGSSSIESSSALLRLSLSRQSMSRSPLVADATV